MTNYNDIYVVDTGFNKYFKEVEYCPFKIKYASRILNPHLKANLLYIRETLDEPVYINLEGMKNRGLRPSSYYSSKGDFRPHVTGNAVDINVSKMPSREFEEWLVHDSNLPYPVRMEIQPKEYTHLDTFVDLSNNLKVQIFYP